MDEQYEKEVRFDNYCKKCKYKNLKESEEPCDECLEYPLNDATHRPVKFKEN